jgi:hypothetical protein
VSRDSFAGSGATTGPSRHITSPSGELAVDAGKATSNGSEKSTEHGIFTMCNDGMFRSAEDHYWSNVGKAMRERRIWPANEGGFTE